MKLTYSLAELGKHKKKPGRTTALEPHDNNLSYTQEWN